MLTVGCVRYLLRNRLRRRRRRPRLLLLALPGLDLLDELGGVLREVDLHGTSWGHGRSQRSYRVRREI